MGDLPLHPAIVHLPIGISFLLPILTLITLVLLLKKKLTKWALAYLVLIHGVLSVSAYIAIETGEDEEHTVEKVISEDIIENHEERAETFLVVTIVLLTFSAGIIFLNEAKLVFALSALLLGQFVLLYFVYLVGHSGGELVFKHGAARAYMQDSPQAQPENHENHGE